MFCSYEDSFEASAKEISGQPFSQSQDFWLDNNLVKERSSPLTEGGREPWPTRKTAELAV